MKWQVIRFKLRGVEYIDIVVISGEYAQIMRYTREPLLAEVLADIEKLTYQMEKLCAVS